MCKCAFLTDLAFLIGKTLNIFLPYEPEFLKFRFPKIGVSFLVQCRDAQCARGHVKDKLNVSITEERSPQDLNVLKVFH